MNFSEPWQVLKRRWLPAIFVAGTIFGGGSLYNSFQKPLYEAKGKIGFKDRQSVLTGEGMSMSLAPHQIIKSLPVINVAIAMSGSSRTPNQVLDSIVVNNVENTLEVKYRDPNPQQAAKLGQKLMEAYLEQDLALRRQEVQANRGQWEKQVPSALCV
jgi:polysaccharide biosynthesis transport protein